MQSHIIKGESLNDNLGYIAKLVGLDNLKVLTSSVDFLYVIPDNTIGIDKIRNITNWIYKKPVELGIKIVYIDSAEKLTIEAQNALLKILEEPPVYAYIFLACLNDQAFLPTITSRCLVVNLAGTGQALRVDKELLKLIEELFNLPKLSRLTWAEQLYTPDKDRLVALINQIITLARMSLLFKFNLNEPNKSSDQTALRKLNQLQLIKLIKSSQKTINIINNNINIKLAFDNYLLDLPSLG